MSYKGKKKSNLYESAEGYDLYASRYDKRLEYLNSFEQDEMMKMLGDLKGKKILDVGCGTGRIFKALLEAGAELTAVDVSAGMLKIAKKKFPRVNAVLANVEKLPFEDQSFDLVIATFLIVHLKDLKTAFKEINRVLVDGGKFILTNINQRKAPKLKTDDGEIVILSHYHRPEDVVTELEDSLFEIENEEFVVENNVWLNQVIKAKK